MQPGRRRLVGGGPLGCANVFAAGAFLFLAACGGGKHSTPAGDTSPTVAAAPTRTAAPTATGRDSPTPSAYQPAGADNGIAIVNAATAALAASDSNALLNLMHYVTVPCTSPPATRGRLGGGPFCKEGQPLGTPLHIVLNATCEGGFVQRAEPRQLPSRLVAALETPKVTFAVARLKPLPNGPAQGITASYLIVFGNPSSGAPGNSGTLWLDDEGIVGVVYGCSANPQEALSESEQQIETLLLPPVG